MRPKSNLYELRRNRGYKNARDFAHLLNVSPVTYSGYETNPSQIPMHRAWKIADLLGCTIDEVVGRSLSETYTPEQAVDFYQSLPRRQRLEIDRLVLRAYITEMVNLASDRIERQSDMIG